MVKYFRYASHEAEIVQARDQGIVKTTNPYGAGHTYFTDVDLTDPVAAQHLLALPAEPKYSLGPLSEEQMPTFDICSARVIAPAYGRLGGGIEYCTSGSVRLFGFFEFSSSTRRRI